MKVNYPELDNFLLAALSEDIGTGDVTTICCIAESAVSVGRFIAKEPGIICGLDIIKRLFFLFDSTVCVSPKVNDGDFVNIGDTIADISGSSRSLLIVERTALNLLQRLSAIATKTAKAVESVRGTGTKITDTRKTVPGLRVLDKYAVRCGGGTNHRFNLSDGILIKDNHIKAAGGITNAVKFARNNAPHTLKIEVETESLEAVNEALNANADIIMLDNMTPEMMTEAVKIINGRAITEASGNMGDHDLRIIASTGVDFISIGALTHSVKALDISLKFD